MAQVQKMMDQVARAVQFVFLFTLFAGLAVLYAAIASTQDERLYQAAIMRTLGASRGQLVARQSRGVCGDRRAGGGDRRRRGECAGLRCSHRRC